MVYHAVLVSDDREAAAGLKRGLVSVTPRHGITALAFASPGRLRGHLADDRDLFDMFEFQRAAADLLSAEVTVYSDGALRNQHVSPDLVAATPL